MYSQLYSEQLDASLGKECCLPYGGMVRLQPDHGFIHIHNQPRYMLIDRCWVPTITGRRKLGHQPLSTLVALRPLPLHASWRITGLGLALGDGNGCLRRAVLFKVSEQPRALL